MMTARDYERIAAGIRHFRPEGMPAHPVFLADLRRSLAVQFADRLEGTNPRFDRARFITAATSEV